MYFHDSLNLPVIIITLDIQLFMSMDHYIIVTRLLFQMLTKAVFQRLIRLSLAMSNGKYYNAKYISSGCPMIITVVL
ncbi:hypothetical protein SDC9_164067 [bioreactor metagenome]|uniref:Uncharacterized protein n=1 Tax=bioreactor metagenome TaxID=1076179 RepID=A0A645FSW3_9ZZZZ